MAFNYEQLVGNKSSSILSFISIIYCISSFISFREKIIMYMFPSKAIYVSIIYLFSLYILFLGLVLALEGDKVKVGGGSWTPATCQVSTLTCNTQFTFIGYPVWSIHCNLVYLFIGSLAAPINFFFIGSTSPSTLDLLHSYIYKYMRYFYSYFLLFLSTFS